MKIINDTLKYPSGKWDKQALTMFISFVLTVAIGVYMVTASYTLKMSENKTAENVFNTFAVLTGAMSGTNILNKLANKTKGGDVSE